MNSYIDIHSHILPQIDDGADSFETSMKMLHIAWKNGIGAIILTPHNKPMRHNASPATIQNLIKKLEEEALHRGIEIRLYAGNEVYYRSDILETLEDMQACTMAGSSYVLVEFGPMDDFDYIKGGIYRVLSGGYRPIIAHIERYRSICTKEERVEELIEMGCYVQVNAGSIMGQYGFGAKHFTRRLLKQDMVHFIATDAHNADKRKPELENCVRYISRKYSEAYASKLVYENPVQVIRNEYI
ncbi:MAG: hypothetical protein K2N15_08310 [Lachnospiraceae bacterium]|nr:hypothetical protein [Lachnospiraceae bacterium]